MEHISNFTDILDDEIDDSQPLSLSSSNNNNSNSQQLLLPVQNRPPKRTGQQGNFRSIEEIDIKYRHVFTYPYFNLVQSRVIEDALYSDKSMVVCAPTGSGKTVVFEMAIVHLLMELEDKNYTDDFKIIYMAPVKALCTERLSEWYPKFNKLGLLCIEVTGDTDVEFPQLKPYRIIITTPEKWDMLTRRWKDYRSLVEVVKLFLIDEVHILNDETRGPVLEAVVSRMKTIESSAQSAHRIEKLKAQYQGTDPISNESEARIRFMAISATVSNPEDVSCWLGTADRQAVYYKFGDECRPVKLKRVVEGYPCADGTSIFKFDIVLNYKLWPIIQKHHNGKPTLIFCNTRKSVVLTAETLSKEITVSFSAEQKMKLTALASTIKNKKIQSLVLCGVGCHHAGLLFEERMNIEHAFRNRDLPILITTTTLAMGVNLPAHLVIIKNTQQYVNGAYQEYSISTILQMVGRAGRPQYDTEATAVIMTRLQDKARYQALVEGSEPLQSYLHKRLAENLNSEAALGTVGDVAQCVQWLNSTFLSVRAARDPKRYLGLPHGAPAQQITKKIEELCVKAMNGLASAGLITMDEASCIESTEAGRLMSVYYLDLETMKLIMKLEGSESLDRLLWLVCESHELSDMHLRVDERRCLNALNRNNAAATIRFPMKGKINSRQMKLNCIIQAVLGCLPIPDPSLNQEAMKIMRIADRVCKCLVSYVTRPNLISKKPKFFTTILNSLILAKCLAANLWENSPYVSRQLKGIGPTFSALLASAGKVNFMLLEESHPRDLERIMNKGPPAGNILRKQISLLPKYNLTATPINERTAEFKLSLLNRAFLAENMEHLTAGCNHKSYVIVGDSENYLQYFTHFKESDLINVYDGCMTFNITRKHNNEQKIFAHCISTSFVGIDEQCQYLFKDINYLPEKIENPQYSSTIPLKSPIQPESSKVVKERKRKSQNDNEITQSKEKRKRESDLLVKFKFLKESFGKASKEIKLKLNKTTEMSNKILQNLTVPEQSDEKSTNKPKHIILSDDSFQNAFQEEFECDDFADDKQVNDILDDIEKEIKTGENTSDVIISEVVNPHFQKVKSDKKYSNMTHNIPKNKRESGRRKVFNKQNNYNFIDMLEKNVSLNIDTDTPKVVNKNGFNDAVKLQIQKYLENTTTKTSAKTDILDLIESEINANHQVVELIENNNGEEDIFTIKATEENFKNTKYLESLTQMSESHLNRDKMILNKSIIDLQEPVINVDNEEVQESMNTYNKEDDIIKTRLTKENSENIKGAKVLKQSEFDLNDREIVSKENCINLVEPVMYQEVEVRKTYNKDDVIIINDKEKPKDTYGTEVPKQNFNLDVFNNGEIVLWNRASLNKQDKTSEIIDLTSHENNNLSLLVPRNKFIFNDNECTSRQKAMTIPQSYEKHNDTCNILAEASSLTEKLSKYQKINCNSSMNTMSIPNSNEFQKLQHFLPFSNIYNSKSFMPQPESKRLMVSCTNDNALDINFNDRISKKEKSLEYMKKHSFRKTNYFDTTLENTQKHKIQLIGKLEINLDVTEIVYSSSDNNEDNSKQRNTTNNNNLESNFINNVYKNKLMLKNYQTNRAINYINDNINKQNVISDNSKENKVFKDSECRETTLFKANPTVSDILQKYNHIEKGFRRDKNNIQYEQTKLNEKTKEQNSLRTDIKPNRRKYKISDLENIQVDLPETLITKSQGLTSFKAQPNMSKNISKDINDEVEPYIDMKFQNNISNVEDEIEDIDTNVSPELIYEDLVQSNIDVDASEAILNPKMLLQSMNNNDTEDIIPPPLQFCDDTQTSVLHEDKINIEHDMLKSQDDTHENDQLQDIFSENLEANLTPSKEIEIWTLSPGVELSDEELNPSLSFTAMRKNNIEDKMTSNFLSSRRGKLSEFIFKCKNTFRK